MTDMKFDRYRYSVLQVVEDLHGMATGSREMLWSQSDMEYAWLKWRVDEGWEPGNKTSVSISTSEYLIRDLAIHVMGCYMEYRGKFDDDRMCPYCQKIQSCRYRPSPEAGPYWRCSECGEVVEP